MHPPTAKLLIAVGVWAFGYKPWAWRLLPALAGTLLAGVFLLLARRVLASERAALFATGLLLCDGVYLVQSRVAMTNVFAVLFQLLAALLVLRAAAARRLRLGAMAAAGAGARARALDALDEPVGLGLPGLVFLALRFARRREAQPEIDAPLPGPLVAGARARRFAFVVLPLLVYLLSYVPLDAPGAPGSLVDWGERVLETVRTQRDIWAYHANLRASHTYFSRVVDLAAALPADLVLLVLGRRAACAASSRSATRRSGGLACRSPAGRSCSGSAARDARRVFAGAGFFLLYLPWGLSPRTLNFSHYLFEAIPYACLSLGMLLDRALGRPAALPGVGLLRRGRAAVPALPAAA